MTVLLTTLEYSENREQNGAITLARAISLRLPPDTSPEINFVVHLEQRAAKVVQGVAEGVVARIEGDILPRKIWIAADALCQKILGQNLQRYRREFPLPVWAIAEGICQKLVGQPLHGQTVRQILCSASKDAAQLLEAGKHVDLARSLREIVRERSLATSLRSIWPRSGLRIWMLKRQIRALLIVFESALESLITSESESSSNLVPYPQTWLDRFDRSCCFPEPPLPTFNGKPANLYPDAVFLHGHPKDATKGHLIEREALAYGLSISRFPNGSFMAYDGKGGQLNFKWSRSPASSAVALALCSHKEATRAVLRRRGLPVPRGRIFAGADYGRAAAYANHIGYPVVLKPAAGLRGIGVISNIQNEDELQEAFVLYNQSELGLDDFVIEQHIRGRDYRIVVVGSRVVSAICREPASVLGDGLHTVLDLALFKNRIRMLNPHLRQRPISLDEGALYKLRRSQITIHSVPEKGQRVELANSSNISRGGDSIETVDELHPSIKEAAIRAVEAIPGLGFCGLDMLLEDHTKPIEQQSVAIIELNAHGAIGTGQYPMWGIPQNVARHLLLHCAEMKGIELIDTPATGLSIRLEVRGKIGRRYRRWFERKATEFGLKGWVAAGAESTLAELEGEVPPVAALVNAAVRGPGRSVPYWVRAEHVPHRGYSNFENRDSNSAWSRFLSAVMSRDASWGKH